MSPKNPPLIAGLAAPGLFWLATSVASGQAVPAPQGPPVPAPTSSTTFRALLLSSGKVIEGEIVEDPDAGVYRLKGNGGTVPYPKTIVLKAADSTLGLYEFQKARLPVGDPDERMRLARWCLAQKLPDQAREQLEAMKAMCPNDPDVKRMLYNLASNVSDRPPVDSELRRTSTDSAPGSLDPRFMVKVQRRFNALPVIFDLPQAQAVVRANEFATYVQPVLQASCVRCHNEKYQGGFQLVEIKQRRDWSNPDVARANLDATLRLINPDDLARSELLSSCLVPHGGSKNAIFRGPNDRPYTILLTWVKSLSSTSKGPKGAEPGGRAVYPGGEPSTGDGFATDRAGRPSEPGSQAAPRTGPPPLPELDFNARVAASMVPPPPRVNYQGYQENAEFVTSPGDNPQFPTPYVVGGVPPLPPSTPPKSKPGAGPVPKAKASAQAQTPATPKGATQPNPKSVVVGQTDDPNQLPGMDQPLYPTSPKADPDDEKDKVAPAAKKPKKIDPALLEKLMKNRNTGTP